MILRGPSFHRRRFSPAWRLGAALVVTVAATAAWAQQRNAASPGPDGAAAGTALGAPVVGDGGSLGIRGTTDSATARPAKPKPSRRSRPPTSAQVYAPVHAPTVSSAVRPDVQPPLTGLPDPAAPAPLPRRPRPVVEDPYGQVGYRLGGVTLYPSIEEDFGYDSNPNRVSGAKKGSSVSRTEGGLRLQSDWPVHELTGELRGAYNAYPNVNGADRPEGSGRLGLRLDATRDTAIDLESRFQLDTQRPGSPDLNADVRERPLVAAYGASAGVTQNVNRLRLGLRGSVDRTEYEDATLSNGIVLDQGDRNVTQYGLRLRAGYELTPGLVPFVEGLADTRVHDRRIDDSGYERDSNGVGANVGTTFELTRLLTGEVSAGYQERHYDDPRLRDLRGPLVDAALVWSATPLTTVRLRTQSLIDETTIAGASGALTQRATLEVQHDLRRNLSVIASLSAYESDYRGVFLREKGLTGSVKVDYRLTRSVALRASFTHERLKSTAPGSDYTANTYLIGLRFQP